MLNVTSASPYEACDKLFADHREAVGAVDLDGTTCSMVLSLPAGDQARFYTLTRERTAGGPFYFLAPWQGDDIIDIDIEGGALPGDAATAVSCGIPLPRHGSLYGWVHHGLVSSLIVVRARRTAESREPTWSLLPLAGTPKRAWPPFAGTRWLGSWFWDQVQEGRLVSLARLVAATTGDVFWLDSAPGLAASCLAIAHDVTAPEGYTLPRGCYLYYKSLRAGTTLPLLPDLLSDTAKVDLAPRFKRFVEGECVA